MTDDRCPDCGASLTSPLTLRNLETVPLCPTCQAVTSIRPLVQVQDTDDAQLHALFATMTDAHLRIAWRAYFADAMTARQQQGVAFCQRRLRMIDQVLRERGAAGMAPGVSLQWDWHEGPPSFYEVRGRDCTITLEARPAYCDRGNWLAKLHARGTLARDLDDSDGWPRYYFDLDAAKSECEAWLLKRGQVDTP